MSGNAGGPWGGGGNRGGSGGGNRPTGGGNGPERPQIPEIEDLMKKGQQQLKVLMGGRGGSNGTGGGGGSGGFGPGLTRRGVVLGLVGLTGLWLFASFYTVQPEERGVELMFGEYYRTVDDGPHLAPWPFVRAEIVQTTTERVTEVGTGRSALDTGLMLTADQAVVDIAFQVVWNVREPNGYLFNLADPTNTVRAVAESAMRDIIARREMATIQQDREAIQSALLQAVQSVLDSYQSGINVIRINLDLADPPAEVIDAFREVQAARQERERLQSQADAYANRALAAARGEAAQIVEQAEAYRAQVVNEAEGEASRFIAVWEEYRNAPEVTRQRMYLETMERVLGAMDLTILDNVTGEGGQGVVPYLPLDGLRSARPAEESN